jgi:hypothetical protein
MSDEGFTLATPSGQPLTHKEAYGSQPPSDVHPNEDKVSHLIHLEDEIQSRLARAELDDAQREEIRLLLSDAFMRWRNALKPAG